MAKRGVREKKRAGRREDRHDRKSEKAREIAETSDAPAPAKRPPRWAIISLIAALVVVVGASLFLTLGGDPPGRALEKWAEATRTGDCDASYGGLSRDVQDDPLIGGRENWCSLIGNPDFIGEIRADRVLEKGNTACVQATVSNTFGADERRTFVMVKEGGRWKVRVGADTASTGIPGCAG